MFYGGNGHYLYIYIFTVHKNKFKLATPEFLPHLLRRCFLCCTVALIWTTLVPMKTVMKYKQNEMMDELKIRHRHFSLNVAFVSYTKSSFHVYIFTTHLLSAVGIHLYYLRLPYPTMKYIKKIKKLDTNWNFQKHIGSFTFLCKNRRHSIQQELSNNTVIPGQILTSLLFKQRKTRN